MPTRKQRRLRAPKGATEQSPLAACLGSIAAPFDTAGAKWPDEKTAVSGTLTSKVSIRYTPEQISGSDTFHNGGICMAPHPQMAWAWLRQTNPADGAHLSDCSPDGITTYWSSVPNLAGMCGHVNNLTDSSLIRCVGMGIRITYMGTEEMRAGKYESGVGVMSSELRYPIANPTSSTVYSILSSMTGNVLNHHDSFDENFSFKAESRIGDSVFEAHWIPNGVPNYQKFDTRGAPLVAWNKFVGDAGTNCIERNQNLLCLIITGDRVQAPSQVGNAYEVEMIWHWEVVPSDLHSVTYPVSKSMYHPALLAQVVNRMEAAPQGFSHAVAGDYAALSSAENITESQDQLIDLGEKALAVAKHPTVKNIVKDLINFLPFGNFLNKGLTYIGY